MKRAGIFCLALLLLMGIPFGGRAAEPMTVYGETVSGSYTEVLSVPVRLKNNRGLMGCSIELSYDADLFTALAVTQGEILSAGLFDYNLESAPGTLRVVWSASECCYSDGLLFTVDFAVKGEAYGSYPIEIRCNSDDTFNGSYDRLSLPCEAAQITLEKANAAPLLYSGSYNAAVGEAVDVFLRIVHSPGLPGGVLTLSYDDTALHLVEAEGELAKINCIETKAGSLRVDISPVAKEKGDGTLLRLRFRVKYCPVKTYTLQWSYDGDVSCHPAQLAVESGSARIYGAEIRQTEDSTRVPVCIAGNPGLMGMKLSITYDASVLQLTSVTRGSLLSDGMFSHNSNGEGNLLLVWSGTENIVGDGELFALEFSLPEELEQDTRISISYSQADTFNSSWQDVSLFCEDITVAHSSQRTPCDGGESCPCYGLTDMPPASHWAHAGIDFVVEQGLMIGVSNTEFVPRGKFTRAMMVMVLYRMETSPEVETSPAFTDVPQNVWYSDAVAWAAQTGVVEGYGDGTFKPQEPITREQIAVMFCRYAKLTDSYEEAEQSHLEYFPDVADLSSWAETEMNWAVDAGLITGVGSKGDSFLLPREHANREQLATILLRFLAK